MFGGLAGWGGWEHQVLTGAQVSVDPGLAQRWAPNTPTLVLCEETVDVGT